MKWRHIQWNQNKNTAFLAKVAMATSRWRNQLTKNKSFGIFPPMLWRQRKNKNKPTRWSGLSHCCYLFNGFPKWCAPFPTLEHGHLKHTRGSKKIQSLKQLIEKKMLNFFSFGTLVMALIVCNTAAGNIIVDWLVAIWWP